ncbi:hypothetical protein LMG31506_02990 [Cupriavidus yeoncheonensis]|uniref:Phage tail tape measure protein domain-containing protein n=1 Tax=Cupriavidus yeoncheonensis TaxID=1462994 RepID=A0A916IVX2_9BURK|nr:phage tail tape measure protein [Cupriavidus yeoncheonensis]CAG2144364.1 hypothetical protein LMG31506_02990 [Cupriavidus yeoncheonensis]
MSSNKRLNAVITIGGAIAGSLTSAITGTKGKLNEVGSAIQAIERRQRELNGLIRDQERLGRNGSAMRVGYAQRELEDTHKQIAALRRKQELLQRESALHERIGSVRAKLQGASFGMLAAGGVGAMSLRAPLRAFTELDDSLTNMQVAMMDRTGGLPVLFGKIKQQTIDLGNKLPGTTADFVNAATALKEQGMPLEAIAGGALKASAHLAVVMKLVPEQAAEMTAKLREAFQIPEAEFDRMADLSQRAKFGFGLKSDDLLLGAKYYGGKTNALGLTGAENVRKVYALQGMAAQQGMDGSTFGTNFGQMLTRLGMMQERLHKNSKEMKAVSATLKTAGIQLEFFKDGKFSGVDNMVLQLDKLRSLTQEKRLQVLTRLFGEEGGRPADLIARNGLEGYRKALEAMDAEASLDQRIDKSLTSFKNKSEALAGTWTNFLAATGEPLANLFTPVMGKLNDIVGGPMMKFVDQNKTLVGIVGGIVATGSGLLIVGGAVAAIGYASTFAIAGLVSIGSALQTIGAAIMFINRGLLMTPVGLVAALIGAAYVAAKGIDANAPKTAKPADFGETGGGAAVGARMRLPRRALPQPAMAGASGGTTTVTDNSNTTINVQQQPGQDPRAFADQVARLIQQQADVRRRGALHDGASQ